MSSGLILKINMCYKGEQSAQEVHVVKGKKEPRTPYQKGRGRL
jgi:hypothetical protein